MWHELTIVYETEVSITRYRILYNFVYRNKSNSNYNFDTKLFNNHHIPHLRLGIL
jgi:hypothetical protein